MKTKTPVTHSLATPMGRLRAWLHFYLKDHHLLRVWWWNLAEIAPGVWRSNQPSPKRLRHYKSLGIRSVRSLRGVTQQSYQLLEVAACEALGLSMENISGVPARDIVGSEAVLATVDAIAAAPKPVVFHCKSGADRTGYIAAVYLIVHEGVPVARAAEQLALKHIHFERSQSGILDHVFRVYLNDGEPQGVGFRDWLETGYDAGTITADFKDWRSGAGRWAA